LGELSTESSPKRYYQISTYFLQPDFFLEPHEDFFFFAAAFFFAGMAFPPWLYF